MVGEEQPKWFHGVAAAKMEPAHIFVEVVRHPWFVGDGKVLVQRGVGNGFGVKHQSDIIAHDVTTRSMLTGYIENN